MTHACVVLFASIAALACAADPKAPKHFTVVFETDVEPDNGAASFAVLVNRSLAPHGADRLHAAVTAGFYNNSAFFRFVPKFVVQWGISGDKAMNHKFLHKTIPDDKVIGSNTKGSVVFASTGEKNSRSTQIFINFVNNKRLDAMGFAPFGAVTSGMDVALKIFNPTPQDDSGVDQDDYETKGNNWIKSTYKGINFVTAAYVTA